MPRPLKYPHLQEKFESALQDLLGRGESLSTREIV